MATSYPALVNPYAPPAYNGINDASPRDYADIGFDYVYNVTLTASQVLADQQPLDNDADFVWRATALNTFTGAFNVRFADSNNYWLSNARIYYLNLTSSLSANALPYPTWPELILPAGGRIMIDIADLSGSGNTIQIAFRGVKRYRINQGQ